jgi:DNA polymerase-1
MIWGFDIETNSLDPFAKGSKILTAAVVRAASLDTDKYLYYAADFSKGLRAHEGSTWMPSLRRVVRGVDNTLVGHNIVAFDVTWWEAHVDPVDAKLFDTMVAYGLLDETGERNSLAALAEQFTDETVSDMKEHRMHLEELPIEDVLEYNISDSRISMLLYEPLKALLEEQGLMTLFEHLMGVGKVLSRMMVRGINLDVKYVADQVVQMEHEIGVLHDSLIKRVEDVLEDKAFNFASSKQLGYLLYDVLEMPVLDYTKTGAPSTSATTIRALMAKSRHGPVAEWLKDILTYREKTKLNGTYLAPLVGKHLGTDKRIHTTYRMSRSTFKGGTVTGRLSSAKPNLQNIPRDVKVKGAFIPSKGKLLFEADYAQLEVRVAAWYSQEPRLLLAFEEGKDIHTTVLANINGVPYEEAIEFVKTDKTWKENRTLIKRIVFGTMYGAGAKTIQSAVREMGVEVSIQKAQKTINKFFATYPDLKSWISETEQYIMANKMIETPFGRRRHLPYASKIDMRGFAQLRQGVNFMIQSLASDVTLTALRLLDERLTREDDGSRVLLTVHDSILGEHPTGVTALDEVIQDVMTTQTNAFLAKTFDIETLPLKVDVSTHLRRWGE